MLGSSNSVGAAISGTRFIFQFPLFLFLLCSQAFFANNKSEYHLKISYNFVKYAVHRTLHFNVIHVFPILERTYWEWASNDYK